MSIIIASQITERYGLFNSLLKLLLRFVQRLVHAIMKGNISYVSLTLCWEYTGHRLPSQCTCNREMSSSIQHPWLHRCSHQAQNTCFFPLPYSFVKVSYSWFFVYQLFLRRTKIILNHVIFDGISKYRLFPFATRITPRNIYGRFINALISREMNHSRSYLITCGRVSPWCIVIIFILLTNVSDKQQTFPFDNTYSKLNNKEWAVVYEFNGNMVYEVPGLYCDCVIGGVCINNNFPLIGSHYTTGNARLNN